MDGTSWKVASSPNSAIWHFDKHREFFKGCSPLSIAHAFIELYDFCDLNQARLNALLMYKIKNILIGPLNHFSLINHCK